MAKTSLTQLTVERIKPPAAGRVDYFDKNQPGFALRVTEKGHKSWTVVYRRRGESKLERITIGSIGEFPKVDVARDRAREILQQVAKGEDPKLSLKPVKKTTRTVDDVCKLFITRYMKAKGRAESYIAETQRIFDQDVIPEWKGRDIRSITRADVIDLLDKVVDDGRPVQANRTLAAVRKLLNWSLDRSYIDASPVVKMSAPSAETDRERVLSLTELELVWAAAGRVGYPFGPLVKLLTLTLQRRGEVAGMVDGELTLDGAEPIWKLPGDRTKNKQATDVPLAALAVEIVCALPRIKKCPFLFSTTGESAISGFAKAKVSIDKEILSVLRERAVAAQGNPKIVKAPPHWTFHDLRRTGSTLMSEELGIAPHVVDAILNHTSSTIKGVARTYNRAKFAQPKRKALDAWAQYLSHLTQGSQQ